MRRKKRCTQPTSSSEDNNERCSTRSGRARAPEGQQGELTKQISVVIHGVVGWAICGATIGVGREVISMEAALLIHAVVAPLAFGLLAWHHFRRFPASSPGRTALMMLGIVVGLDGLVVAPLFERSYAMFRSVIGTWLPFASILAATYLAGRVAGSTSGTRPLEK